MPPTNARTPATIQPAPLLRPVRPEHIRASVLFEPVLFEPVLFEPASGGQ
jgi:hypothetical protein